MNPVIVDEGDVDESSDAANNQWFTKEEGILDDYCYMYDERQTKDWVSTHVNEPMNGNKHLNFFSLCHR